LLDVIKRWSGQAKKPPAKHDASRRKK